MFWLIAATQRGKRAHADVCGNGVPRIQPWARQGQACPGLGQPRARLAKGINKLFSTALAAHTRAWADELSRGRTVPSPWEGGSPWRPEHLAAASKSLSPNSAPLVGPGKSLLRYRGKASAELAPLTCYADLEVYSTPAPTVHIAQQQPARQTVAASSCYVAVGRCGYVPPEELRLRLTHHERDSDKYHAVRAMLNDLRPLPHLETPNSARQHDPARGAGAQGRHSLQGAPRVLRDR